MAVIETHTPEHQTIPVGSKRDFVFLNDGACIWRGASFRAELPGLQMSLRQANQSVAALPVFVPTGHVMRITVENPRESEVEVSASFAFERFEDNCFTWRSLTFLVVPASVAAGAPHFSRLLTDDESGKVWFWNQPNVRVLLAPKPPTRCPTCGHRALNPVRDEQGLWTWACFEGCNP